jgi:hypothetical protein
VAWFRVLDGPEIGVLHSAPSDLALIVEEGAYRGGAGRPLNHMVSLMFTAPCGRWAPPDDGPVIGPLFGSVVVVSITPSGAVTGLSDEAMADLHRDVQQWSGAVYLCAETRDDPQEQARSDARVRRRSAPSGTDA